jgi:predicted ArsR family transcriptional regulator
MEDETSKSVAEVLGSKTCKKIINHLAEIKEASQKDLSDALKIPMNTLDYNMKKLLESGFIQKKKNFFWSKKGKKIIMYELSNKSIVISPKKSNAEKIKSIIPAFIVTAVGTFAVSVFEKINSARTLQNYDSSMESAVLSAVAKAPTMITPQPIPLWVWFLFGATLAIFIISIINWRKL